MVMVSWYIVKVCWHIVVCQAANTALWVCNVAITDLTEPAQPPETQLRIPVRTYSVSEHCKINNAWRDKSRDKLCEWEKEVWFAIVCRAWGCLPPLPVESIISPCLAHCLLRSIYMESRNCGRCRWVERRAARPLGIWAKRCPSPLPPPPRFPCWESWLGRPALGVQTLCK